MVNNLSKGEKIFKAVIIVILILFCLITLYPLVFVLSSSFSSPEDVYSGNVVFFPVNFSIQSYIRLFQNNEIITGYLNTILYTFVGTFISVSLTFMAAYPLSRKDMRGRNFFMLLFVFTMFFSGGIVPLYMLIDALSLTDTMWAVILPGCVSVWNLIVVRTYISTAIPYNLQESAMIDGASGFRLFFDIILPLCKPILVIMILFYFVGYWNNYFNSMMFLSSESKFPLQLVLRNILIEQDLSSMVGSGGGSQENLYEQAMLSESIKYSAIVVSTLPILLIYPFLSKYFEKGIMVGSLKG